MSQLSFNELKQQAESITERNNFSSIKVGLVGDSATQFYKQALVNAAICNGINLNIYEADYDQVNREILDVNSGLYQHNPEIVILELTAKKLLHSYYKSNNPEGFAQEILNSYEQYYHTLQNQLGCKVIIHNVEEIDDQVFGNYANKLGFSFIHQLRKINVGLGELSQQLNNLFVLDVSRLHNLMGREFAYSAKFNTMASVAHSIDFTALKANEAITIINAINGKFNKCLILDLDNTLWGGIIGDDGIENIELGDLGIGKAYTDLQLWAKQLKQRGIILAVCSKNEETIAKEPFEKHPDMVLKLDDIAVFVANWNNKADNIRYIQEVLNIGFDSMVFLDDNPAERAIVRENLPEITVPELPADPAEYIPYLQTINLFETASHSEADETRTKQYQEEAKRKDLSQNFTDVPSFLKSLEMKAKVRHFEPFDIPRVAQLTQRSNQFNLRTVRYTDEDIKRITADTQHVTYAFNLEDKFGDYGLISLVIANKQDDSLFIDTWIMSCRVLKRGVELLVLDTLVEYAKQNGFAKLVGEYIPTPKNKLVENHYKDLGFIADGDKWVLDISTAETDNYFIQKI